MPLLLTSLANPGTASWEDASTVVTSGGMSYYKTRITSADLTDAATNQIFFSPANTFPENAVFLGSTFYVTTAPAGPALTSLQLTTTITDGIANSFNLIELQDIVATPATASGWYGLLNAAPDGLDATTHVRVLGPAALQGINVTSNINVNTLTDFDVTFFTFYSNLGLTVP